MQPAGRLCAILSFLFSTLYVPISFFRLCNCRGVRPARRVCWHQHRWNKCQFFLLCARRRLLHDGGQDLPRRLRRGPCSSHLCVRSVSRRELVRRVVRASQLLRGPRYRVSRRCSILLDHGGGQRSRDRQRALWSGVGEIDLNPVLLTEKDLTILDAKVAVGE